MRVPYREIAYQMLIEKYDKSEKEAERLVNLLTTDELETYVHVKESIRAAINKITNVLNLDLNELKDFEDAIYNGPVDASIFKKISELINELKEKELFVINTLSDIHDEYIKNNSNEETINRKKDSKQLRQYVPFPLIGLNEVANDLIILKPILEVCGLDTKTLNLDGAYHYVLYQFLLEYSIYSKDDLKEKISTGQSFYPAMSKELADRLTPLSNDIGEQIYNNWQENDRISAITFLQVQKESLKRNKDLHEK